MVTTDIRDIILKISLVFLGLIYPLIMLLWVGPLDSISAYFNTPAQVLFLLINAGTSFYFVNTKGWILPGILLLLLSCFSVEFHLLLHNIFAVLFFIVSTVTIFKSKRYSFLWISTLLSSLGLFHSIFLAEYLAIMNICLFHGLILRDLIKIFTHKSSHSN